METKRKYTDETGADKGTIHLMINRFCGNSCPLCYKKQYDLDTVPVATVEELKSAHTVLLTGGDPFAVQNIADFCCYLRYGYSNIKHVYIYTSGWYMFSNKELFRYPGRVYRSVDGINFSPKRMGDYEAIKNMLTNGDFALDFFSHVRNNRIVLMPNDFMTREQQEEYINSLPLKGLTLYGAKFEVEYREWQEEFKPNGGVLRRLSVFL